MEIIDNIITKVRTKKYATVDEQVVREKINEFLKKEPKLAKKLSSFAEKSSEVERIIKYVKQELHRSYGAFQKEHTKRAALLEKLRSVKTEKEFLDIHKQLLLTHSSTKERIALYDHLYDELFKKTGVRNIVLDLGCGLNPASLPWMNIQKRYIASEFNRSDTEFIQHYFSLVKNKFPNVELQTEVIDLKRDLEKLKKIPADVVFAWKVFDILTTKEVEAVVKSCNATYLIASFSTKTLGEKRMTKPRRTWFEMMLNRIDVEWDTKEYDNEIFYIIRLRSWLSR
jgi:hypothetical protein